MPSLPHAPAKHKPMQGPYSAIRGLPLREALQPDTSLKSSNRISHAQRDREAGVGYMNPPLHESNKPNRHFPRTCQHTIQSAHSPTPYSAYPSRGGQAPSTSPRAWCRSRRRGSTDWMSQLAHPRSHATRPHHRKAAIVDARRDSRSHRPPARG